ncbi:diguanylate cyclase [Silicimonas algicola]|uniref:diguanylate cyclase n=1 Tax=Silicimonas algicola TaxID=1826607 RepID=A0A316G276_9RHOB|nr:diguanylate cyclase [Silicimonas algicola]AZQ69158.1 diguanylate cyclase [Silicimonas algicola]PWK55031.1 response regulator receiver modulated diguanylate cyclase [Silicimonas algicola]
MPKCVFVIDSVATNRIRLSALVEQAHHRVASAETPAEAGRLDAPEPDLIVLGLHGGSSGEVISGLRGTPGLAHAPILCLDTAPSPMRRLQTLRSGARDILSRSMPDALLLARIRGLLRDGETERECERRRATATSFGFAEAAAGFRRRAHVACVGDLASMPALPNILGTTLPHRFDTPSLDEVLRDDASAAAPEAYVFVSGPGYLSLDTLLPELRDRSHSRHAPVLVVHPGDRPDIATRALNLGAGDVAAGSSTGEELAIRIDAMLSRKRLRDSLRQSDEQSYRLAATDPLTGLYNRRYAESYLADMVLRAHDDERGFALMLIDIDHFKEINDRFGHTSGDRVLVETAARLRDNLRACDLVCRYGGEEFLVILPETEGREVERTAERLRDAISSRPVSLEADRSVPVTASIGVAVHCIDTLVHHAALTGTFDRIGGSGMTPISQAFEIADKVLYRAKSAGRNRVEFSAA